MKIVNHQKSSLISQATTERSTVKGKSVLTVQLTSGKEYSYLVPDSVVEGLENAVSAGRYFNETIRGYEAIEG
jgi:hypothetical protein